MISVLIPTKNEERDLPACLRSVAWCDDIHVYDSYSTDGTVAIAKAAGANVTRRPDQDTSRPFGGDESSHRDWGLRHISFRHPWVLHLDADERATPELHREILDAVRSPGACSAFEIERRDYLFGTWLRHVQASPFYIRLFRPECMRYERLINPVAQVEGDIGRLSGFLEHFPFSKGFSHWLERHNSYSTFEAQQIAADRSKQVAFSVRKAFSARDFHERRFHQKALFYRLPARPLLKFLLLYVLKRGFLDGRAGFTYAVLQSFYEYMIVLKTREVVAALPVRPAG